MSIGAGLGLGEFPFSGARGYWRWVEYCEASGVDSLWQSDRLVSHAPQTLPGIAQLNAARRRPGS